jgi:hypothetical protein
MEVFMMARLVISLLNGEILRGDFEEGDLACIEKQTEGLLKIIKDVNYLIVKIEGINKYVLAQSIAYLYLDSKVPTTENKEDFFV